MKLNPTPLEIMIFLAVSIALHLLDALREADPLLVGRAVEEAPQPTVAEAEITRSLSALQRGYHALSVPWQEVKGKAGRKKTNDTKGYACMNPRCACCWLRDLPGRSRPRMSSETT